MLDYTADAETLGKNFGDDLAEGKPTLPLILGRKLLDGNQKAFIDETIRQGGIQRIDEIVELIRSAVQSKQPKSRPQRSIAATEAVDVLPGSNWKDAMRALASYSVSRNH